MNANVQIHKHVIAINVITINIITININAIIVIVIIVIIAGELFSVTRRSRSDVSHLFTY